MAKWEMHEGPLQVHDELRIVNENVVIVFTIDGVTHKVPLRSNEIFIQDSCFKGHYVGLAKKKQDGYCFMFSISADESFCIWKDTPVQCYYCKRDDFVMAAAKMVFADCVELV